MHYPFRLVRIQHFPLKITGIIVNLYLVSVNAKYTELLCWTSLDLIHPPHNTSDMECQYQLWELFNNLCVAGLHSPRLHGRWI
ncbi:hypothetical protein NMY22_g15872 [Coprinellus aureogranulatus]|nr:hypothetical protein NMY22_g15872 [Coprinellus aureogranulatus]